MKFKNIIPLILIALAVQISYSQQLKSPREVFGFPMGSDRELIHWEQIVSYFQMLDREAPRLRLQEIGKTTLQRPMIMAIISSEQTISDLAAARKIQEQLARPFALFEDDARELIRSGKLVFLITLNIHSTEIAASQESVELAYELATSEDPRIQKILENVIILLVPSLNPDGQDMVSKWYMRYVGTPYEGSRMPQKYHHYADHDNNRDWFFFNLVESRNVARVLYHDWYPEIVLDQHQMGSSGARLFLPPYADPVNPNVPPSLMADVNLLGKYVVADMHNRGFTGLVTNTIFNAYFEGTMSKTPLWHNRIGILTEAASVRIATPLFFPKTSLRGMGLDLPEYKQQTNFLDPWPGGWWRLRDIIDYEKAATYAMLDFAATFKDRLKSNFYRLNRSAIEQGNRGKPYAYIIPRNQHDPNSAAELLRRLRIANVDVYRAQQPFSTREGSFQAGDFIVPLAQPARAYIKDLMENQHYPDLREYPGGPPRRPYDITAWTLPLMMGVKSVQIDEPFQVKMSQVDEPVLEFVYSGGDDWVAVERRFLNSYKLVNSLLQKNVPVYVSAGSIPEAADAFIIKPGNFNLMQEAGRADVPLKQISGSHLDPGQLKPVRSSRIGLYQPYIPWAYDEGWTRLVFDNFGFQYQVLHNEDFKNKQKLSKNLDLIVFGSQNAEWIFKGTTGEQREPEVGQAILPEKYRGGIGKEGVATLREFLKEGGTLLFFGEACDFAIEHLRLPAQNILKGVPRKEFFAPGSIVEVALDRSSPLTAGMPETSSIYINNSVALSLKPYLREISEVAYYRDRDLTLSGWVVGEEKLQGRVALADIPVYRGRVILYAFRPQHRGQTYGTFKLVFNALYR